MGVSALADMHAQMDDVASDENDMPAAVQDDPILSRSLLKGSMEDFLGHGMYEEVTMFRGKVRGVSQRKLKQKQKASGLQNVVRDLGLACGSVKFAIRVTDTSSGGKSFGELPKVPVANQVMSPCCCQVRLLTWNLRADACHSRVCSAGDSTESHGPRRVV
jgi:hypothetical protein